MRLSVKSVLSLSSQMNGVTGENAFATSVFLDIITVWLKKNWYYIYTFGTMPGMLTQS